MSEESLFEKGLKVRKEVLGEDYANKSIAGADEFVGKPFDAAVLGEVIERASGLQPLAS